jgi:uncharacterized lipoprotein YmbA
MTKLPRRIALILPLAALAACASPVPTPYRLTAQTGTPRPGISAKIAVRDVGIPSYLDQSGLLKPSSGNALDVYDNAAWAGTIGNQLQEVMVEDLTQRLPNAIVLAASGAIGAPPDLYLELQVLDFAPDATGTLHLTLQLATRPANALPQAPDWQLKTLSFSAPGATSPQGLAAAMSTLWAQAADATLPLLATP